MKTWLLGSTILLATSLVSCSSAPRRVTAKEFHYQWDSRHQQTIRNCFYLGEVDGKAYMLLSTLPLLGSEFKESVISTPLKDLNSDLLNEMRASASKSPHTRSPARVP